MESPDLQRLMGDALWHHQAGRFADAERVYRQILMATPDSGAVLNNLGDALCALGRPQEAEVCFRRALSLSPKDAEAHNNLGTLLFDLGKPAEAEPSFRTAIALQPEHIQAHANLGAALHAQHRLAEAEGSYRQALALEPKLAPAAANLAAALWEQSKLDEAAVLYRRLIGQDPRDGEALSGLAAVTLAQGDVVAALDFIRQALAIRETAKARRIFTDIARQMRWTRDDAEIPALMARAISEPWARPRDLAKSAAGLIKQGKPGKVVTRALAAKQFQVTDAEALAEDRLLMALLVSTQNTDLDIERFLTLARQQMLSMPDAGLEFWSALARQCFINEYVFFRGAEETQDAEKMRDTLAAALEAGGKISPMLVLAVAAYFQLAAIPMAKKLLDQPWPQSVDAVLTQQLREPEEEERLRAAIPRLTPIEDDVSQSVRAHYEENPFPRWIKPAPADNRSSVAAYLRQAFPLARFETGASGTVELLSAGCGTGQLAIESARSLDADVLAVDLSLASLGYAKRKAEALGLYNISFAQADILTLGQAGKTFDVIEASGVLHHMAEPFAGWRALLDQLRPGGVMLVALYSRLARRNIERTRKFIAERGYGVGADAIRQCRQDLLAMPAGENFMTDSSDDFFGISTCRDLLFHGQETLVDLGGVGAFLKANRLSPLGFEIGSDVLFAYRRRFPDDPAAQNLDHWQAFEADNPDTFAAMYNFWVQKPV